MSKQSLGGQATAKKLRAQAIQQYYQAPNYCQHCADTELIETINSPTNLIALCPNHHWEFDHHLLNL